MTISRSVAEEARDLVIKHGSIRAAAKASNIPRPTIQYRIKRGIEEGHIQPLTVFKNPRSSRAFGELVEARKREFLRVRDSGKAYLSQVKARLHWTGPFCIVALGDEHLDNPGTDLELWEKWISILDKDNGVFGFSLGDWLDNWLRILGFLHGESSTTAEEAWVLLEGYLDQIGPHLCGSVSGNHDDWASVDLLGKMMAERGVLHDQRSLRVEYTLDDGESITLTSRHRWFGNSQWNEAHAIQKAAKMGIRDDILIGGDKHISGDAKVKCPISGNITHCYQVAAFKMIDKYADELALTDKHISPAVALVIQPDKDRSDPHRVTPFYDPHEAMAYLDAVRSRAEAG